MERLIQSVADDVIYCVSHGNMKPSKHLCLALTLKSLTGSRKIIEILNRFGHCVGYYGAEQLETQLATTICDRIPFVTEFTQLLMVLSRNQVCVHHWHTTTMMSRLKPYQDMGHCMIQ